MNRVFAGFFFGLLLILLGTSSIIYADGPYHGKVIHKDAKQPIEGAAVLALWYKRTASLGHPSVTYYDAQETLTDSEGNFTIPGVSTFSVNPFSRIDEPRFTIFKPGYQAYPGGPLQPLTADVPTGIYEKDGRMVVELKQLTTPEEKLENLRRVSVLECDTRDKCPNLIRLRNIEAANLGLPPTGPVKMLKGNVPTADGIGLTGNAVSSSDTATGQHSMPPDFVGIWTALKDALRRGDIETALSFISVKSRERYRGIFTALGPQLSEIDQILTTIKPVAIRRDDAQFEMVRSGRSFEVLFLRDDDGIWRVASF